jgi:hypothetical protein
LQITNELFQRTILRFGRKFAPADPKGYLNNAIWEALDDFASASLNDMMTYSNCMEEHVDHVMRIIQSLWKRGNILNWRISNSIKKLFDIDD